MWCYAVFGFGHVSDILERCFEHVLDVFWTCSGRVWDMVSTCRGQVLGKFWTRSGHVLDMCSGQSFGHAQGMPTVPFDAFWLPPPTCFV